MDNKILILGDGCLGSELHKQTGWDYISRKKSPGCEANVFNQWSSLLTHYHTIINCIAYTTTFSTEKTQHWDINYKFVSELVDYCNKTNKKLVHISTDYVYTNSKEFASENDVPIHGDNWYSYTKLLADAYIELRSNNYLICRGTHKPKPFPYKKAWINQIGNFDYVDVMAYLIILLINKNIEGIVNIGTESKSMFRLALQTSRPEACFKPAETPDNTTMDLLKLNNILK